MKPKIKWLMYWKSIRWVTTIKNIADRDNAQHGSYINRGNCNRYRKKK